MRDVLQWFTWTHQEVATLAGMQWQRVALPEAGGIADQDVKRFEALEVVRRLKDDLSEEARQRSQDQSAIARWWRRRAGHG